MIENKRDIFNDGAIIRPGDFPLGSEKSRAAARLLADTVIQRNSVWLIHFVPRPGKTQFNSADETGQPCNVLMICRVDRN
jgi:hypothetical protein